MCQPTMGPEPMWPNIQIDVTVVFEVILSFKRVRHIAKTPRGNCAGRNVVINRIQKLMICDLPVLFGKTEISCQLHK